MDSILSDAVMLARLQFAFTISFHILFPAFTIGLAGFIATLEIMHLRTGRPHLASLSRLWTKVFAVSFAMGVVSGIVIALLGHSPIEAFRAIVTTSFKSSFGLIETVHKWVPLVLLALAFTIPLAAGKYNIGGEGQLLVGATASAAVGITMKDSPLVVLLPLVLLVGVLAGGVYAWIAAWLMDRFGVNEILSTVMMNSIAVYFMNFLLRGPLIDPAQAELASKIPQTARLLEAFRLPRLVPTRLHLGILIAVLLAVVVYIVLWRTTLGYRIRAVGQNPHASRYGGIKVKRYMVLALLLSGDGEFDLEHAVNQVTELSFAVMGLPHRSISAEAVA